MTFFSGHRVRVLGSYSMWNLRKADGSAEAGIFLHSCARVMGFKLGCEVLFGTGLTLRARAS